VSAWYEVAFDRLYPVLYQHRDDEEAVRAAAAFAPRLAVGGLAGPVLDLACGAGRHMKAFAALGLDMVGLDLSNYLLDRAAREPELRERLVRGDMRALPFCGGAFAAVVNMFTSFGYFDRDDEHGRVLREVARVLRPGGRFLLDYINAPVARSAVAGERGRTEREAPGGYRVHEERRVEEDGSRLVKRVRVTHPSQETVEYEERVRLFAPDELAEMLASSGLDVRQRFGDYDGGGFDAGRCDRLILLCERSPDTEGEQ
jgi:SAM-dependent methyltransferase